MKFLKHHYASFQIIPAKLGQKFGVRGNLSANFIILFIIMYERIGDTVKKPANCVKLVKVLTYLSAALLSIFGLMGLVFMILNNILSSKFFLVFSPIFIIFFGVVIVAVEMKAKIVVTSFNFLQTLLGKGLFYIYLSSSVFYFFTCGYQNIVLAWTSAMILFGLGGLFTFLHFSTGQYTDQVKEKLTQI